MASQLAFEGPVLEDLLERVRAEVGPDARIVAANRVRRGGVGGFFAREAFEVLVEPPDSGATNADDIDLDLDDTRAPEPEPIVEAVASRKPARAFARKPPAAAPARRPRASIPASSLLHADPPQIVLEPASVPRDEHTAMAARHATILELADAVSEYERNDVIDLIEERNVSTQSRDFAQVLDRFSRSIDATPEELAGESAPPREGNTRASEIDIRETARVVDAVAPTEPAPAPTEPIESLAFPLVENEPGHASATPPPGPEVTRDALPRVRRSAKTAAAAAEVIDRYETRLSKMGLPARLIPRGVAQPALKGALVESLTRLPAAPGFSNALGTVIVVVGTGSAPVLLARELAGDYALDPDEIVLATREQLGFGIPAWLQMTDAATAQERRRSWRRRTRPTIVACSLPRDGLSWARAMLDELEPTITWAIVDAGSKREDITHRVDALGGVDVLALDHLDDTVSPATALELGIPVGRLELEHASPLTWTELLLERMQ